MDKQQNAIDFLKINLQGQNRGRYLQMVKQTLGSQKLREQQPTVIKPQSQEQLALVMQVYEDFYRKFMYSDTLSKSSLIIDQCSNAVHPGLKVKKDGKHILAIISKIFVQQLIEESLQVVEEYKRTNKFLKLNETGIAVESSDNKKKYMRSQEIDIDVIEEAYRRKLLQQEKL